MLRLMDVGRLKSPLSLAGLEFHGSLFISNPPTSSNAKEDKDVFESTGTQCNRRSKPTDPKTHI